MSHDVNTIDQRSHEGNLNKLGFWYSLQPNSHYSVRYSQHYNIQYGGVMLEK